MEQLRNDAAWTERQRIHYADPDDRARLDRLAALALAVAMMMERPGRIIHVSDSWDDEDQRGQWAVRVPMTMDYDRFNTLPAALAALLAAPLDSDTDAAV